MSGWYHLTNVTQWCQICRASITNFKQSVQQEMVRICVEPTHISNMQEVSHNERVPHSTDNKKRHVFFFRQRGRWQGFLYWVSSVISLIRARHCSCLWMRWFWITLWTCQWTCWKHVIVVVGLKVSPTLQWVQMSFFLRVWLVFRAFPFFLGLVQLIEWEQCPSNSGDLEYLYWHS